MWQISNEHIFGQLETGIFLKLDNEGFGAVGSEDEGLFYVGIAHVRSQTLTIRDNSALSEEGIRFYQELGKYRYFYAETRTGSAYVFGQIGVTCK